MGRHETWNPPPRMYVDNAGNLIMNAVATEDPEVVDAVYRTASGALAVSAGPNEEVDQFDFLVQAQKGVNQVENNRLGDITREGGFNALVGLRERGISDNDFDPPDSGFSIVVNFSPAITMPFGYLFGTSDTSLHVFLNAPGNELRFTYPLGGDAAEAYVYPDFNVDAYYTLIINVAEDGTGEIFLTYDNEGNFEQHQGTIEDALDLAAVTGEPLELWDIELEGQPAQCTIIDFRVHDRPLAGARLAAAKLEYQKAPPLSGG